jgi:nucleoid-associated protein YgaU
MVGLTPVGAANPSPPTVPGSADAPSSAPLQAPEPLKLAVADVDPSLPESKLEQVSVDPKSASPSGAGTAPSAPKPSPNPSLVPVPVPVPPANPSMTLPASHDIPELKPPVPKPSPSPVVAPLPVPGPTSSPASSPAVQAATDPKQSEPKPGLPVKHAEDNLSPKSDPLPATVPKHDEPTPAAEAATSVAGANLPSAPEVLPTKAPVANETVVKAPVAVPPPVATPVAAAVAVPVPVPVPVPAKEGPRTTEALKSAGWVELPSIGKLSLGREQDVDSVDGDAPATGSGAGSGSEQARRARSRDVVSFGEESSQPQPQALASGAAAQPGGERTTAGSASGAGRARNSGSSRVEPNVHVVEKGENFWSISRFYYSSARYYRALWKANADKYPDISVLHVNDEIIIPAVEDLDPAYIDAPGLAKRGSRKDDAADLAAESLSSPRSPAAGKPTSRPLRNVSALDLPVSDTASSQNKVGRRTSLARVADEENDNSIDEPEIRQVARPRRTDPAPSRRPVYKVHRNDSLRSIARDVLGDYHRADELYELNRDVIKDPSQLVVGQLLELPDDAKTTSRR